VVRTNHNNLRYFLEKRDLSERHQKWVSKVEVYEFYIEYVKRNKNVVIDTLSRRSIACSMTEISTY
jgi:hypothetical protein